LGLITPVNAAPRTPVYKAVPPLLG